MNTFLRKLIVTLIVSAIYSICISQSNSVLDIDNRGQNDNNNPFSNIDKVLNSDKLIDLNLRGNNTHRLDSTIGYTYDFNTNTDKLNLKNEYEYEEFRDLRFRYKRENGTWRPQEYYMHEYNNQQNLVRYRLGDWSGSKDGIEELEPTIEILYEYNADGKLIKQETKSKQFIDLYNEYPIDSIFYNSDGQILCRKTYLYDISSNILNLKWEAVYNYFGENLQNYILLNNDNEKGWIPVDSVVIKILDNNLNTQTQEYKWNIILDEWDFLFEKDYEYNSDNEIDKLILKKYYDSTSHSWEVTNIKEYFYSSINNVKSIECWIPEEEFPFAGSDYVQNEQVLSDNILMPREFSPQYYDPENSQNSMIESYRVWNSVPERKIETLKYYYSKLEMVNTENIVYNSIEVFPNPTKDIINISSENLALDKATLTLYTNQGKILKNYILSEKASSIELSEENPGIYFYELRQENQLLKAGKIVKI